MKACANLNARVKAVEGIKEVTGVDKEKVVTVIKAGKTGSSRVRQHFSLNFSLRKTRAKLAAPANVKRLLGNFTKERIIIEK